MKTGISSHPFTTSKLKYMKKLLLFLCLVSSICLAQEGNNYTITINGETFDYQIGSEINYNAKKKGPLTIVVEQKNELNYNDGIISFMHTKDFPVSETVLEEGIKQIAALNSTGMGILIQEYEGFDPSLMVDLMLNEVTKESVDYGYSEEISSVEFTSKDGRVFKGKKSILTYQGTVDEWIVVAYGWKDAGVLIATMSLDAIGLNKGAGFVDDFFSSLEIIADKQ
jgi:hypothetical protein